MPTQGNSAIMAAIPPFISGILVRIFDDNNTIDSTHNRKYRREIIIGQHMISKPKITTGAEYQIMTYSEISAYII